jgi:nucleotide-binding universal stress UspA family protein
VKAARRRLPVVVGIDGSKHAMKAAIWAIDEAIARDTHLRLVHVIDSDRRDLDREYAYARRALHRARSAVEATGWEVKLESEIVTGDPVGELVKASRSAELVCGLTGETRLRAPRTWIHGRDAGRIRRIIGGRHTSPSSAQVARCRPMDSGGTRRNLGVGYVAAERD